MTVAQQQNTEQVIRLFNWHETQHGAEYWEPFVVCYPIFLFSHHFERSFAWMSEQTSGKAALFSPSEQKRIIKTRSIRMLCILMSLRGLSRRLHHMCTFVTKIPNELKTSEQRKCVFVEQVVAERLALDCVLVFRQITSVWCSADRLVCRPELVLSCWSRCYQYSDVVTDYMTTWTWNSRISGGINQKEYFLLRLLHTLSPLQLFQSFSDFADSNSWDNINQLINYDALSQHKLHWSEEWCNSAVIYRVEKDERNSFAVFWSRWGM